MRVVTPATRAAIEQDLRVLADAAPRAEEGRADGSWVLLDYGDIELLIEYKTVPLADSGIYLRATPQVQIWDNKIGSGGLYGRADLAGLNLADYPAVLVELGVGKLGYPALAGTDHGVGEFALGRNSRRRAGFRHELSVPMID